MLKLHLRRLETSEGTSADSFIEEGSELVPQMDCVQEHTHKHSHTVYTIITNAIGAHDGAYKREEVHGLHGIDNIKIEDALSPWMQTKGIKPTKH